MAGRSVTVSALRHRPRQAALVVVLASVVSGAAAMGALYARAVEQSVLRTVVSGAPAAQRTVVVQDAGERPASPTRLARTVRPVVPAQFGPPVRGADTDVVVSSAAVRESRARLVSRAGLCRHLDITDGRCARAPGEVLVSRRSASTGGPSAGDVLRVVPLDAGDGDAPALDARVVGVYESPDEGDGFWAGSGATGPAAATAGAEDDDGAELAPIDDVLTTWATLGRARWPQLRTHLVIALDLEAVDLSGLAGLATATERIDRRARTVDAAAVGDLAPLLGAARGQGDQARQVVPVLVVQLAMLGAVVLAFVCAAATDQRRPEIALARLRGHGTRGTAGLLLRELGVLVVVGAGLGAGLGWLAASAAARAWLHPGVTLEVRWPVAAAVGAAALAGLLAVVAAGAPTLRQPVTTLLRRVPPRTSTLQVGLVEGALVAAAGAGLVTLLSGEGGPVALLAPGLLAVTGGVLLAQLAVPVAGPLGRRELRRGRLVGALAAAQVARRPALRRLVAIVTVACALLVFAVDVWSVSAANRATRAEVEAGAPVVLAVDAATPRALRDAVLDIDPRGRFATPVVQTRSATDVGPTTTAVEPAAFARVAGWGDPANRPTAGPLAALRLDKVPAVPLPVAGAGVLEVTARFDMRALERPQNFRGTLQPLTLAVEVTEPGAEERYVGLGRLRTGAHTYVAALRCARCTLSSVVVDRTFGDSYPVDYTLRVDGLRAGPAGDATAVDLGPATPAAWQVVPFRAAPTTAEVEPGPPLTIRDPGSTQSVVVRRGDTPAVSPALAAGALRPPFRDSPDSGADLTVAPDLAGAEHLYVVADRLPLVPRSGPSAVLVDLATAAREPSEPSGRTTYEVWLAADDPAREGALRRDLAGRGLQVVDRDTTAAHRQALAAEGPTLALRLAIVAGVVALCLAAAVLVVGLATSGASRARDLAALRVVGVPAATVRAAAVREHLAVAVLGVLAGSVLGAVAAQAALPRVPLFAAPLARVPLDLTPAWAEMAATAAACLVVVGAVSVAVGRALAGSATPERLRDAR